MTTELTIAWILFWLFVTTHQQQTRPGRYQGASAGFLIALQYSTGFGGIASLVLLIMIFLKNSWYVPFLLGFIGILFSTIIYGLIATRLGETAVMILNFISFIGWPVCAVWIYYLI